MTNAMKGQIESPDQLVGVYQLMIRRGSITQERFYDVIEKIFSSCYQAVATAGRRYYCMNRKKLIDYIGDDNAAVIELSIDMANEEMMVEVKRSLSPDDERKFVDSTALQLYQIQLLDKPRLANLMGRGTEDDLWIAMREFVKESEEMQRKLAEQQKKQEAMALMMGEQQQQQQQDTMQQQQLGQAEEKALDRKHDLTKVALKGEIDNNNNDRQLTQSDTAR